MRWSLPLLALALAACASTSDPARDVGQPLDEDDGAGGTALLSYEEVAPIIDTACASCHEGKFDTLEKVKTKRDRIKRLIEDGLMPRRQPGWKDSEDGKLVLKFLAESPELQ